MRCDLVPLHRELTAEREHWRPIEVGMSDAGHEVGRAGTERGEANAGNTCRRRRGLGHECGGGLVLRENELEPCLLETFDEVDDFSPRVTVDVPHARSAQPVADRTRDARSHTHRMPP